MAELEERFEGSGYGDFKGRLAEAVVATPGADPDPLRGADGGPGRDWSGCWRQGAERAARWPTTRWRDVRDRVGLVRRRRLGRLEGAKAAARAGVARLTLSRRDGSSAGQLSTNTTNRLARERMTHEVKTRGLRGPDRPPAAPDHAGSGSTSTRSRSRRSPTSTWRRSTAHGRPRPRGRDRLPGGGGDPARAEVRPPPAGPDRDDDGDLALLEERDLLLARLVECSTFREAGAWLCAGLERGTHFHPREVPLEEPVRRSRPRPARSGSASRTS